MVQLSYSEACERNKQPILEVLKDELTGSLRGQGVCFEIGSGTGQHVVYFAQNLGSWCWQPSDRRENLEGLQARVSSAGCANIFPPVELDVLISPWPSGPFDAVYSANTAHIMGWSAVKAMFAGVENVLRPGGSFLLYGPFIVNGEHTAPSNAAFDRGLRARDPAMGIRDISALESLATGHQLKLVRRMQLPANNQALVFHHTGEKSQESVV